MEERELKDAQGKMLDLAEQLLDSAKEIDEMCSDLLKRSDDDPWLAMPLKDKLSDVKDSLNMIGMLTERLYGFVDYVKKLTIC